MVNIMTIDGIKFLVDVGSSSFSPVQPMELRNDVAIRKENQQLFVQLQCLHIPTILIDRIRNRNCGYIP